MPVSQPSVCVCDQHSGVGWRDGAGLHTRAGTTAPRPWLADSEARAQLWTRARPRCDAHAMGVTGA
jgi:hypothetical protein